MILSYLINSQFFTLSSPLVRFPRGFQIFLLTSTLETEQKTFKEINIITQSTVSIFEMMNSEYWKYVMILTTLAQSLVAFSYSVSIYPFDESDSNRSLVGKLAWYCTFWCTLAVWRFSSSRRRCKLSYTYTCSVANSFPSLPGNISDINRPSIKKLTAAKLHTEQVNGLSAKWVLKSDFTKRFCEVDSTKY